MFVIIKIIQVPIKLVEMIIFTLYILSTSMLNKSAISLWQSTYELHMAHGARIGLEIY